MKKILFFIESLAGGGAEKVLATLVSHIDKTKFDITVLTVAKTGVYVDEVEKHCKLRSFLPNYTGLTNGLERLKYKLDYRFIYSSPAKLVYHQYIHEQYDVEIAFVEGFATKLIAASTNPTSKKICWLHIDMEKNPYADAYYWSLAEEKNVYQRYDAIIAVSKSVKETFERKFGLKDSVKVIYNPVDSTEIIQKSKDGIKASASNGIRMISIGRLVNQKGYDRLIAALASPRNSQMPFQLWILGEGEDRSKLEEMIKMSHLEEKVFLVGFQKNPYPWIVGSDVFICSSRAEGYSLAIAEAMILEKPVISVDCSGPNELLGFGNYGLLVPNTDTCLEEILNRLLTGQIDLKLLAEKSSSRSKFFELHHVVEEIEGIL